MATSAKRSRAKACDCCGGKDFMGAPIVDHCPPGACVTRQWILGPVGWSWMIYECRKCGCWEGL